jgi:CheY-like chemotaxis protein
MLERDGFAVVGEAADGASGLTLARELAPDVILVDVALPDGSGFDVAERLRVDGPDVVLVSTRERADLGPRLDSTPALGFIQKDELTSDAIRSLLRDCRTHRGQPFVRSRCSPASCATSHDQVAFTTFFGVGELGYALVAHVTLAYPTGIVRDRAERWFLGVAYTVALAFPLATLSFYNGDERLRYFDPRPRDSALLLCGDAHLARTLQDVYGSRLRDPRQQHLHEAPPLPRAGRSPPRARSADVPARLTTPVRREGPPRRRPRPRRRRTSRSWRGRTPRARAPARRTRRDRARSSADRAAWRRLRAPRPGRRT